MPTPNDDAAPPSPPLEVSSSRASFTSCPPDEEREQHAPREARAAIEAAQLPHELQALVERAISRTVARPEPSRGRIADSLEQRRNDESAEDSHAVVEESSPVGSPDASSESDIRLAQSMDTTVLKIDASRSTQPEYLACPTLNREPVSKI